VGHATWNSPGGSGKASNANHPRCMGLLAGLLASVMMMISSA